MKKLCWLISLAVIGLAVIACGGTPAATTQAIAPEASSTAVTSSSSVSQSTPVATPAVLMKPGDYNQKISSGGVVRTYILHVPPGYDGSKPLPLVFVLHGFGGAAAHMAKLTGMSDKADQKNFFVAYLNGTPATDALTGAAGPAWNTGLTPQLGLTVDDVAFVRELLKDLEQRLRVESARVYAAGFSNGGFMTHRLGAELPDLLAGVAVVEGSIGLGQPDGTFLTIRQPLGPMPLIIIHGRADMTLLYEGGPGTEGRGKLIAKSVADAVAFWTQANGCTGAPLEASSTGNVIVTDYRTCVAGSEVQLYTILNGEHEWPTLQGHTKFSATDAIWEFFNQHQHP